MNNKKEEKTAKQVAEEQGMTFLSAYDFEHIATDIGKKAVSEYRKAHWTMKALDYFNDALARVFAMLVLLGLVALTGWGILTVIRLISNS